MVARNGHARKNRLTVNEASAKLANLTRRAAANFLTSRADLARSLMDPEGRDLDAECGYPTGEPHVRIYRQYFDREGLATCVVRKYPDECWSVYPELYETEKKTKTKFERAWTALRRRLDPWPHLHRVDVESGIGRFGVLLLGLDAGAGPLDRPVPGILPNGEKNPKFAQKAENSRQLLYLRAFPEDMVNIVATERDEFNPRFGQPVAYDLQVYDPISTDLSGTRTLKNVHWSRVIHVADNRGTSEIFGVPRMRPVLNRLWDLRKILGGSGEMFWRGAFPGYAFEAFPDVEDADLDEETIKEQFESYANGLKRYLAITGMKVSQLLPQIADPTNHVAQQILAICATLGIPMRVFLGTEEGKLASVQDANTWNRRLARRQLMYLEPYLIRPFVDRLMVLGVLPPVDDYIVSWKDLNSMSDEQKAGVALKKAQALMQYVTSGSESILPVREFFVFVLGMTEAEAQAALDATRTAEKLTTKVWEKPVPVPGARPQGGGRTGNAPRRSAGRPAATVPR